MTVAKLLTDVKLFFLNETEYFFDIVLYVSVGIESLSSHVKLLSAGHSVRGVLGRLSSKASPVEAGLW